MVVPFQQIIAQEPQPVRLSVTLSPDSSQKGARAPYVRSENLLEGDGRWLAALRSGLPVRLHYRVEVWRSRDGRNICSVSMLNESVTPAASATPVRTSGEARRGVSAANMPNGT